MGSSANHKVAVRKGLPYVIAKGFNLRLPFGATFIVRKVISNTYTMFHEFGRVLPKFI